MVPVDRLEPPLPKKPDVEKNMVINACRYQQDKITKRHFANSLREASDQ